MQDQDRPSSETAATPQPPAGANIKDLVTPGGDAETEAKAIERVEKQQGAVSPHPQGVANPDDDEAPEEANSPT